MWGFEKDQRVRYLLKIKSQQKFRNSNFLKIKIIYLIQYEVNQNKVRKGQKSFSNKLNLRVINKKKSSYKRNQNQIMMNWMYLLTTTIRNVRDHEYEFIIFERYIKGYKINEKFNRQFMIKFKLSRR
ncbi:unnamed protein product [Paramecium sonneborni]|uniref:Uncharacterized protein n=1 Tax=Paramecium sonneborni TaxID=65129 RepID=A0A8S1QUE4_9CILI|nr:unnamed protein product [Paramecium sonneborni]